MIDNQVEADEYFEIFFDDIIRKPSSPFKKKRCQSKKLPSLGVSIGKEMSLSEGKSRTPHK
jgi:hypothetical protein